MESAAKLKLIATIVLLGFIVAIFFHGFLAYLAFPYPYNTFLFQPWDRFNDFICIYDICKDLNPYAHATNYFPLAYFIFYPLTLIGNTNAALLLFLTIFCCFMCWNANYFLQTTQARLGGQDYLQCVIILCFLSYPTLLCLDRANLDALVFIFLALFIMAFTRQKYILAALPLAIGVAMKGFPLVFIILFFKQKKYLAALLCLVFTGLLSLLALASFKLGIAGSLKGLQHMVLNFGQNYIVQDGGLTSSISIFSFIKVIMKYFYLQPDGNLAETSYRAAILALLPYYTACCGLLFAGVTAYILRVETVVWKQVMLLTICLALLPAISGDYRLIFFYLPLLLYLTAEQHDRYDKVYALLFGLLLVPKNFFILPATLVKHFECLLNGPCGIIPVGGYSVMSVLNISLTVVFAGLIMVSGCQQRREKIILKPVPNPAANLPPLQSPPTNAPDYL